MRPVLSVAEMRRVDAETDVDIDLLMDRAGLGVALAAVDMGIGYGSKVHVLAGKGNNGGDGYVAAAYLAKRGAAVTVHVTGPPAPGTPASRAVARAQRNGATVKPLGAPEPTDLIIDAIVGTGFQGQLQPEVAAWIDTPSPVLGVDFPSGLDADTGVPSGPVFVCDTTVAFHAFKPGHFLGDGPDVCGDVVLVDIGLTGGDPVMWLMTAEDVVVRHRRRRAHKWSSGAVTTVGGAPGLTGAAGLAALAALRAGAGVSAIASTPETDSFYQHQFPEVPVMATAGDRSVGDAESLVRRLDRFDAVIVGPGLEPAAPEYVATLLGRFPGVVVVDAGALNAVSDPRALRRSGTTVLTPHAGEFTRLTGAEPSVGSARDLARAADAIVVMKGNPTIVASADEAIIVDVGGPELATIGTGDVLAGTIAAFVGTNEDALVATASAAYVHGLAGADAASQTTPTVLDVLHSLGPAVRAFRS